MDQERRKFLRQMAAACATGIAHNFKIGAAVVAGTTAGAATSAAPAAAAAVAGTTVAGTYGAGVRAQVFEVIVRQGLAGAPWREICAGPMQVNNIDPTEIEKEMERRKLKLHDSSVAVCHCVPCLKKRLRESRERQELHNREVAAIQHSEQSPCACNKCTEFVLRKRRYNLNYSAET